ncbi:MAG: 16S rRNA (cytosine(1402)-N(4))-methyltransferase RsmH [Actinobacteria bacterium]|nr:MAG: 16S rRNA (cytosine(1402)-N(4))-methyltransferase RsmH [Actinomycetota bacterium]
MEYRHQPVLLAEVLKHLCTTACTTVVDCTLGGAGHAEAILSRLPKDGRLIGIDQDVVALSEAKARTARFGQQVSFVHGNFRELDSILAGEGVRRVDGILFDLGVSSPQLDVAERGFSYRHDHKLDMRMDPDQELSAYEVVNAYPCARIAQVLREYGEEKWAGRIAEFICRSRERAPIETTAQLAKIVKDAIPAAARRTGPHPARRTFQALRIEVNRELESLEMGLQAAVKWLRKGGRVAVLSYHSLEDRIVKKTFNELAKGCVCPPRLPECRCGRVPFVKVVTKRAITPGDEEIAANPRARSAKLRVAERV